MGLDFDAIEYIKKLKAKQDEPPFICPVEKCGKSYKSIIGLQYHLVNYDHDNPTPVTPMVTPHRKRGRARLNGSKPHKNKDQKQIPKEAVYCESEDIIQFNFPDGKSVKVSAIDPLPIISNEEYLELLEKSGSQPTPDVPSEPHLKLPEASYKEIETYDICDAPPRPNAYIRFIEKSAEELDGEVEYDVDEEDTTWLNMINEKREEQGMNPVSIDTLELLMDRLEKESYFQAAANGQSGALVDDDAICCICLDGECQNTNVILFCDMCNLAVHQDCYGVPYIPEGQWLCRKCLQSPSTPVNCVLCPNTGGAFKQTDRNNWAHVVCALWIPEVRFANTVFLEPIDSIEMIPPARWRLTCYICKEKGIGACIQCQRNSCYAAFHVTCAQQAGLYMHMDTVKDHSNDSLNFTVQKSAYCHAHTPPDAKLIKKDNNKDKVDPEPDTRHKMKKAREVLAKKRSTAPVVLIPTIPPDRVQEISSLVTVQKKSQFITKLIAYWTLKRQYRNGVPLLRRLQSQGQSHSGISRSNNDRNTSNASELYQQLKYWQCLRQDLERARLLCELVRKREKLKVANIRVQEQIVMLQINPIESAMSKLMDSLVTKDTTQIFLEPVNTNEVPDYLDIVKTPMDLGTMREKLNNGKYYNLDEMESDFDLMIKNCLAYNNKDTIFYRAGIRMRDQCGPLFKNVRQELAKRGLMEPPKTDDVIAEEIDKELKEVLKIIPPTENEIQKLLILVDQSQVIKNPSHRTRKIKQIRFEIQKMRKVIMKAKMAARKAAKEEKLTNGAAEESSQEDEEMEIEEEPKNEEIPAATPPCSPLKSACNSASPSGVNRRTAVLFTRKAQAVSKRPEITVKEESSCETPPATVLEKIKSPKRSGKKRLSNDKSSRSSPSAAGNNSAAILQNGLSPKKLSPHKEHNNTGNGGGGGGTTGTIEIMPDSFRVYRANANKEISETEDSDVSDQITGSPCSSCSGFGVSGSGSEFYSTSDDDDDEHGSCSESDEECDGEEVEGDEDDDEGEGDDTSQHNSVDCENNETTMDSSSNLRKNLNFTPSIMHNNNTNETLNTNDGSNSCTKDSQLLQHQNNHHHNQEESQETTEDNSNDQTTNQLSSKIIIEKPPLEPLQLVWAKCRGYPWYPALIIDPATPKGFVYNGVPLPAPPQDVLNLRKNYEGEVFLVLFFDVKRTWQWLPNNKLDILGIDKELDQGKLIESKKPQERKAVKKAYADALLYQSQVTDLEGQGPDPIM